jgi:thiol-disulfide isomerase/thioredoxin
MLKPVRLLLPWLLLLIAASGHAEHFSFPDTQGKTHTLTDLRGKWVLVNFWATWCPPCLDEIPDLVALHDKHKDKDLVVIGVAMDYKNPQEVIRFADDYFISYPVVLGNNKLAAQVGAIDGLPSTYLYNPQGKLVARHVGALTRKAVENYITGRVKR